MNDKEDEEYDATLTHEEIEEARNEGYRQGVEDSAKVAGDHGQRVVQSEIKALLNVPDKTKTDKV